MLVSALSYECRPCADGFYSVTAPTFGSAARVSADCAPCPPGAICSGVDVVPKGSYYGVLVDGAQTSSVRFLLCPAGYCVEDNEGDGEGNIHVRYALCAKGSHRDWTQPLCGACLPGYAQSISTANCIADDTCAGSALWFGPVALLYCLAYAAYFLWSTPTATNAGEGRNAHKAVGRAEERTASGRLVSNARGLRLTATFESDPALLPQWATAGAARLQRARLVVALKSGGIPVTMFFYQMAGIVVPLKGLVADMGAELKSFFGMQVASSESSGADIGGGYCIWAGMTSLAKVAMHFAIPIAMAAVLRLLVAAAPLLAAKHFGGLRARFPGALAQLLLVAYATLTTTTLQLLRCIPMPDGKRVLFLAGATDCSYFGWQLPLYVLMLALVALPAAPLLVFGARRLPPHWQLAKKAEAARFPASPTAQALRAALTKPFAEEYWHWPALLALQRLLMVATPILFSDTLASSVILAFIAFFMQNLQLSFTPYANADVNKLQKLASDCLLALALLNIPQRALSQASVDVDSAAQAPLKQVCDKLVGAMAFFLLAPLFLPVVWVAVARAMKRSGGSSDGARGLGEPLLHEDDGQLAEPSVQ
jgi:hypothetical protein